MLPSPPSPCKDLVCEPAVGLWFLLQGTLCTVASPRATPLVSRWPRRVDMERPRTPPHARGLATGQPSRACSHRDALELLGNSNPSSLTPRETLVVCELGFDPSVFTCK
jgi:hypothetical protein